MIHLSPDLSQFIMILVNKIFGGGTSRIGGTVIHVYKQSSQVQPIITSEIHRNLKNSVEVCIRR